MAAGTCPGLWTGKRNRWPKDLRTAPMWKTQRRLLASGPRSVQILSLHPPATSGWKIFLSFSIKLPDN